MEEDYKKLLVQHGHSIDCAQWVVDSYANNESYKDNVTVQQWVKGSQQVIDENKSN